MDFNLRHKNFDFFSLEKRPLSLKCSYFLWGLTTVILECVQWLQVAGKKQLLDGYLGADFLMPILAVKKAFKICGTRKHKSRFTMSKGTVSKLFLVLWGRLSPEECAVLRGDF